jgi:AraC-like DNA-binding protein
MLIASGGTTFGAGSLRSCFVFGPRFGLHVVRRDKVVFDTRFVPPAAGSSEHVSIFLIETGVMELGAPVSLRVEGPTVLLIDEDQFEGHKRTRPFQIRSYGDPFVAIELRLHPRDMTLAQAPKPRTVGLDEGCWRAIRELTKLDSSDPGEVAPAVASVLRELARCGVLAPSIADQANSGVPQFSRLWSAITPMVARYNALPTLQEVASASGLSLRQVARDLRAFFDVFRFFGVGWRDLTVRIRLKMATLVLSAPGATVGEVAKAAGYGSTEAMARAFRDAGLPPPSAVQAALVSTAARS